MATIVLLTLYKLRRIACQICVMLVDTEIVFNAKFCLMPADLFRPSSDPPFYIVTGPRPRVD